MKRKSVLGAKIKKAKVTLLKMDPTSFGTGKPLPSLQQTFVAASRGESSIVIRKKGKK